MDGVISRREGTSATFLRDNARVLSYIARECAARHREYIYHGLSDSEWPSPATPAPCSVCVNGECKSPFVRRYAARRTDGESYETAIRYARLAFHRLIIASAVLCRAPADENSRRNKPVAGEYSRCFPDNDFPCSSASSGFKVQLFFAIFPLFRVYLRLFALSLFVGSVVM